MGSCRLFGLWILIAASPLLAQQAINSECGLTFSMPSGGWESSAHHDSPTQCTTFLKSDAAGVALFLATEDESLDEELEDGKRIMSEQLSPSGFLLKTRDSAQNSLYGSFAGRSQTYTFSKASAPQGGGSDIFVWAGAYPAGVGRKLLITVTTAVSNMWAAAEIYRKILGTLQIQAAASGAAGSGSAALAGVWSTVELFSSEFEGYAMAKRSYVAQFDLARGGSYTYSVQQSSGAAWLLTVNGQYSLESGAGGKTLLILHPARSSVLADVELKRLRYEGLPGTSQETYLLELDGDRAVMQRSNGAGARVNGPTREFRRTR